MERERSELITHPEQPGRFDFTVKEWYEGGYESFEITEEEKFEIRELAVALVNRCIELKVPCQVFAIGGLNGESNLLMNTGNLWPPTHVTKEMLVATSVFKESINTGMLAAIELDDYVRQHGHRKPKGGAK